MQSCAADQSRYRLVYSDSGVLSASGFPPDATLAPFEAVQRCRLGVRNQICGFRALAYVENGECRLASRNNNVFKNFGSLCASIGKHIFAILKKRKIRDNRLNTPAYVTVENVSVYYVAA